MAARLQQAAEPWSIVVGERTVRAAGERFQFGPQLQGEAKGNAAPMAARELVARRTLDERRPFLVSIVAPVGVGKSRLPEEFLDRLDWSVQVATAQCLPYGQCVTYWPMRAILLSIVELGDETTPDDLRSAVVRWLRYAGEPDPESTAELLAATVGASEVEGWVETSTSV